MPNSAGGQQDQRFFSGTGHPSGTFNNPRGSQNNNNHSINDQISEADEMMQAVFDLQHPLKQYGGGTAKINN